MLPALTAYFIVACDVLHVGFSKSWIRNILELSPDDKRAFLASLVLWASSISNLSGRQLVSSTSSPYLCSIYRQEEHQILSHEQLNDL
jgi:hypothetical protein